MTVERLYYKRTSMYADGGKFKHTQMGEVLDAEKKDTGIAWCWTMDHKRNQQTTYTYKGKDYATFAEVKVEYEKDNSL